MQANDQCTGENDFGKHLTIKWHVTHELSMYFVKFTFHFCRSKSTDIPMVSDLIKYKVEKRCEAWQYKCHRDSR